MNRRDWLTKTSLALAGGLVLGDAAMEAYERLTHKKVWALGEVGGGVRPTGLTEADLQRIIRESYMLTLTARDHIYVSVNALNRYARLRA